MEKEEFKQNLIKFNINDIKCKDCSDVIYYYDSKINNNGNIKGKSYLSFWNVNNVLYNLCICEECLVKEHPEYINKNKGRIFCNLNDITAYAYGVKKIVASNYRKSKYSQTESNMIKRHGEIEGTKKWKEYKGKQALSNLFEYKNEKHGWTKEQFDSYNAKRSCTLENLIQRHGEILGTEYWLKYLEDQKVTKSKDYVVNKYGLDYWYTLCSSKAHTMDNYIKWHGDLAEQKFEEFWISMSSSGSVSRTSQKYIHQLDQILGKEYKTYFYDKDGKEYGKNLGNRWVFLDYFILELNLCIEYNGDLYHANPKFYKEDDEPIPFNNMKALEIWEKDNEKISLLKEKYNIDVITVWESDLPLIEDLIKTIKSYDKR